MADTTTPTWRLVPVEPLETLAKRLRNTDWNLRAPQELADLVADSLEQIYASPAPQELPPVQLPEPAAFRTRYRSEPGMLGNYPWHYEDRPLGRGLRPEFERETLFTADQLRAAIAADRRAGGR